MTFINHCLADFGFDYGRNEVAVAIAEVEAATQLFPLFRNHLVISHSGANAFSSESLVIKDRNCETCIAVIKANGLRCRAGFESAVKALIAGLLDDIRNERKLG